MLVGTLAGERPVSGTCPVATVVISGGGAGDQSVGSPDVNVLVGWETQSAPTGEQANRQVVAKANRSQASKSKAPHENRRVWDVGSAETFSSGRRPASSVKKLGAYSR
jgi:hypothetical protein